MYAFNILIPKLFILLCCLFAQTCSAVQKPLIFTAEELPPYHFINSNGQADGALVEIVQAVLEQAKLPGIIAIQPFARGYAAAKTQQNTFLFSLLKTPSRDKQFKWVGETYRSYAVLLGLKDRNDIKLSSLDDAKPLIVGTIRGYHSAHFLVNNGFHEHENLSLSVTSKHMWAMLFNNRIDLVLTNYMALDRDIKDAGFDEQGVTPYLSIKDFPNELNIATGLSTTDDIVKQLSQALAAIKKSGTYQKILTKYDL
jgi:polar amino acid transport system substrate-binding protein